MAAETEILLVTVTEPETRALLAEFRTRTGKGTCAEANG